MEKKQQRQREKQEEMISNGAERVSVLNCIDLSNPDISQSVSSLKQACLDSGFFYVANHGISEEFMGEVFSESRKFFGLPLGEKMKEAQPQVWEYVAPMKR